MPAIDKEWKFRFMTIMFKMRDTYYPREKVLSEAAIVPGNHVLDFGCGSGSYIRGALDLAGPDGKVYALDESPFAIKAVDKLVTRYNLSGVETIQSNLDTGLNDEVIDVILLYDIFHMIENQDSLLHELNRVLKPEGLLSFSDHHMKENDILSNVSGDNLFKLFGQGKKTYTFVKM